MTDHNDKKVRRPTEEKALALISKEAAKAGLSQFEYLERIRRSKMGSTLHKSGLCTCLFCRLKRRRIIEEGEAA